MATPKLVYANNTVNACRLVDPAVWTSTSKYIESPTADIEISNSGEYVAYSCNYYVYIRKTSDWSLYASFSIPTPNGAGLSWSSDDLYIAAVIGASPYLKVYDVVGKAVLAGTPTPPATPTGVAWYLNSQIIVTMSGSPGVRAYYFPGYSVNPMTPTLADAYYPRVSQIPNTTYIALATTISTVLKARLYSASNWSVETIPDTSVNPNATVSGDRLSFISDQRLGIVTAASPYFVELDLTVSPIVAVGGTPTLAMLAVALSYSTNGAYVAFAKSNGSTGGLAVYQRSDWSLVTTDVTSTSIGFAVDFAQSWPGQLISSSLTDTVNTSATFSLGFSSAFSAGSTISVAGGASSFNSAPYTEQITLYDTLSFSAVIQQALNGLVSYADAFNFIQGLLLSSGLSVSDNLDSATISVLELSEVISTLDSAPASVQIATALLSNLVAHDLYSHVASLTQTETINLAAALEEAIQLELNSAEALALRDTLQNSLILIFSENAVLADALASPVSILSSLADVFAFISKLPLEDGDYSAYVMNTDTNAVSEYTNFPFNSLVNHNGSLYGITDTGLYELTGDTDDGDPIDAWIATGDLDFGTSREKNLPRAYLYLTQKGEMLLKTVTSTHGARKETLYELRVRENTDDNSIRRVPLGRTVRGAWWRIELHNVDGANFDLRAVEALPVVLSRSK